MEYGGNVAPEPRRSASSIDVMTGIPSIVAGLFAYALFRIIFGPGTQIGFGGGVALSHPDDPDRRALGRGDAQAGPVRSARGVVRPGRAEVEDDRQGRAAHGAAGIVTGITLAIARVIGETAPLIIICGVTDSVNTNLFNGQMESLPVFIYLSYTQPGLNPDIRQNMAWGAALVLVIIVAALNLLARLAGRLLAPKTGR